MDNNQPRKDDQQRMSRSQYRQQQRQGKVPLADEGHPTPENDLIAGNSREATANQRHQEATVEKIKRLKRRLNIAIIALIVAIIIVYLILFYVG